MRKGKLEGKKKRGKEREERKHTGVTVRDIFDLRDSQLNVLVVLLGGDDLVGGREGEARGWEEREKEKRRKKIREGEKGKGGTFPLKTTQAPVWEHFLKSGWTSERMTACN